MPMSRLVRYPALLCLCRPSWNVASRFEVLHDAEAAVQHASMGVCRSNNSMARCSYGLRSRRCFSAALRSRRCFSVGGDHANSRGVGEGMAMAMADGSVHNDGTRCEQYLVRVYAEWK